MDLVKGGKRGVKGDATLFWLPVPGLAPAGEVRKATLLSATRSFAAGNLRWAGFAGESLELAALRQSRRLIPQNPPSAGAYSRGLGADIPLPASRAAAQHIVHVCCDNWQVSRHK